MSGGCRVVVVTVFVAREALAMAAEDSFPRRRRSASHAASLQAEIERVRRMTIEERIKASLGMASRFAELRPAPRKA